MISYENETIAAIATKLGVGAISIIRISGKDALSLVNKIFEGFQNLNKGLIKGTNCNLFTGIMIKLVIFNALALIF